MIIKGHDIPAPRPTRWAGIVLGLRYGLALVAVGAIVDLILLTLG